jgi:hypothetical protein
METVGALIEALGGLAPVSEAAGVPRNTVTYWERRKRIPPEHWEKLIALAATLRIKQIDHATMLKLHRPRKQRAEKAA